MSAELTISSRDEATAIPVPELSKRRSGIAAIWQGLNRLTPFAILLIALVYLTAFIPPNVVGARDEDMLNVAGGNPDYEDMYNGILAMKETADTWQGRARNWLNYGFYYYGYPFFLMSGLATLPVKFLVDAGFIDPDAAVTANVLLFKEVTAATLVLVAAILVYLWTGFRNFFPAVVPFVFLLMLPITVAYCVTWHPECLMTLFIVLTLCCLYRDDLRLGRWFYFAAIGAGFAVGTKLTAIFLAPTIAVYLAMTALRRTGDKSVPSSGPLGRRRLARVVGSASAFFLVFLTAIVASNPLLVFSKDRADYWQRAKESLFWSEESIRLPAIFEGTSSAPPQQLSGWIDGLNSQAGRWPVAAIALAICIFGIVAEKPRRLLYILVLAWSLPLSMYLVLFATPGRSHYLLAPVFVLISCFASPALWSFASHARWLHKGVGLALLVGFLVAASLEMVPFAKANLQKYRENVSRVSDSEAIATGEAIDRALLQHIPANPDFGILRDWDPVHYEVTYVPRKNRFNVNRFASLGTYKEVREKEPELLILHKSNIQFFSDASRLEHFSHFTEEQLVLTIQVPSVEPVHEFYRDAARNHLLGYHRVWENDAVAVFQQY